MKNLTNPLKQKLISKYTVSDSPQTNSKRTDINVLLNRVKSDKKQEVIKKFYFSAAASTGLILFGLVILALLKWDKFQVANIIEIHVA